MVKTTINVNRKDRTVEVSPDTPLLWVLRDTLGLSDTRRLADANKSFESASCWFNSRGIELTRPSGEQS